MAKTHATFYCPLHDTFDLCRVLMTCDRHRSPTLESMDAVCTCLGLGWTWKRPETECKCVCHTHSDWSRKEGCYSCCEKKNKVNGVDVCLCLCHTRYDFYCSVHIPCCKEAKGIGETDTVPLWPYGSESEYPFTQPVSRRRGSKQMSGSYGTMHLKMTVTGDEMAKDLFYILLHEADPDFPIDPMRRAGATVPVCSNCGGMVWEKCVLGTREILRAAEQVAGIYEGLDLDVRVHHWQKPSHKRCDGSAIVQQPAPPTARHEPRAAKGAAEA
jgi:hypothetical protein